MITLEGQPLSEADEEARRTILAVLSQNDLDALVDYVAWYGGQWNQSMAAGTVEHPLCCTLPSGLWMCISPPMDRVV